MDYTQEKQASFFRFEDLRIYAKSTDYSAWLIANLKDAANDRQRNILTSFCHSSFDISLNIAEGSSRNKSQFEHYLKISKTAIRECIVYTRIAAAVGLMDEEAEERSRELLMEMTRMIGALILSLQRGSGRKRSDFDTEADAEVDNDIEDGLSDEEESYSTGL